MRYDQSSEEEGVWRTRLKSIREDLKEKDGLNKVHQQGVRYLNNRIYNYLFFLAILLLFSILITSSSVLVTYGMVFVLILLTIGWGWKRIDATHKLREERTRQVREINERPKR